MLQKVVKDRFAYAYAWQDNGFSFCTLDSLLIRDFWWDARAISALRRKRAIVEEKVRDESIKDQGFAQFNSIGNACYEGYLKYAEV